MPIKKGPKIYYIVYGVYCDLRNITYDVMRLMLGYTNGQQVDH